MDELWVPCSEMVDIAGVRPPIKIVPHSTDLEDFRQTYNELNIPQLKNKFVFYFVGEYNRRKNLAALIKAFHIEFEPDEPVELVLKVNKPGMSAEALAEEMVQFCNGIKEGLRLYKEDRYKKEIIITLQLPRPDLLSVHQAGDCFVCPSRGEAWCIPAFEAMAMGNLVISTAVGGPKDYIDSDWNGLLVNGSMEPVFGQHETVAEFGTARERWMDVSVASLAKAMRYMYSKDKDERACMEMNAWTSAAKYSHDKIGQKMKEFLNV
jgi:glycosyltransferase involved in cell wall biosynthesis